MALQANQATPAQKLLANALKALKKIQQSEGMVLQSSRLTRPQRESLLAAGFIQPIINGWYMSSSPGDSPGDSTPWLASMKAFIAAYCNARFGDQWCVSAELSLQLQAGSTWMPRQMVVHAPKASNSVLELPQAYSLLAYQSKDFPDASGMDVDEGLRKMSLVESLVRVSPTFFQKNPLDAQVALQSLSDVSDLSRRLLSGRHSTVAGRLAGAFKAVGKDQLADDILSVMRSAGYKVTQDNPFATPPVKLLGSSSTQPHVIRMRSQWALMREQVITQFKAAPMQRMDIEATLRQVESNYLADAYHSLSIEGYQVTDALILRVASGGWRPDDHPDDKNSKNAMAAHGYWLAHNAVKDSIRKILGGANPGDVLRADHGQWFRKLFEPSVTAGILDVTDLAGYRTLPVYIKHALHVPPGKEKVRDMMPAFFELLKGEPEPAVRAVLGHFMFVYIHPYMDGNGRMGRFIMNTMLASAGYPWTVIRLEDRSQYMSALNAASTSGDITPFARFIFESVKRS